MDETLLPLLGILAGVLLLAAVVVFGVVGVMWQRRRAREAERARAATRVPLTPAPRQAARPASVPTSQAPVTTPPLERARRAPVQAAHSAAGLPGDPDYGEDELPTVVVATPPRVAAVGGVASANAPAPSPTSRRSAGATIIAFDDDDAEDE